MCRHCLGKGVVSALSAGLFALIFFSAFWYQQSSPFLSADWNTTLRLYLKYAVAFFFLGLAKVKAWEAKQAHEMHMGGKKRR